MPGQDLLLSFLLGYVFIPSFPIDTTDYWFRNMVVKGIRLQPPKGRQPEKEGWSRRQKE